MLGYALKQLRKERGVKQYAVAAECDVTQSTVSKWERSGDLPDEHLQCASRALGVGVTELRSAAARSRPGMTVHSREELEVWRDAVAISRLVGGAKLVLVGFALPQFVDPDSWLVETSPHAVADAIHLDRDEVYAVWEDVLGSSFVEQLGGGQVFKLKFPEN